MNILEKYVDLKCDLPEGYSIQSYNPEIDLEEWANLLNEDSKFGFWNSERVRDDIVFQSLAPECSLLLFYNNKLIGCCSSADYSKKSLKVGIGMWLIISKKHRSQNIAMALMFRTLSYFAKVKYDKVIAYTDPWRLPALYLYLSNGVMPEYDSLSSFFKWWQVKRRLRPLLERAKKRKPLTNSGVNGHKS